MMPSNIKQEGSGGEKEVSGKASASSPGQASTPTISLPKGGGAIRGMGEKFSVNPATGTGSLTVPIFTSPGRSDFYPKLSLGYDSGSGNGPFGLGWNLAVPSVTRKTDKGLPRYRDVEESDTFILSDAEDLVPCLKRVGTEWEREAAPQTAFGKQWNVRRYRPRIEGLFARIERWRTIDGRESHWRVITRENVTSLYGYSADARIFDPNDSSRIFRWLLERTYDDKGNVIVYEYKGENSDGIELSRVHESNRTNSSRSANRYLKRIKYCNKRPHRPGPTPFEIIFDDGPNDWLMEVVFDYGEHYEALPTDPEGREFARASNAEDPLRKWSARMDAFSTYRAGFETRSYRLCRQVLMFHHFSDEPDVGANCLVRSTDFAYSESPVASFISSVKQSGYRRSAGVNTYFKRSLPPLEFEYSQVQLHDTIHNVDAASVENLPIGVDGGAYQWVDLDGEGVSGILTEYADAWYYKRNLSPANRSADNGNKRLAPSFGATELVSAKPSLSLNNSRAQFLDLAGDGQVDLVTFESSGPGFYERTADEEWKSFRPFSSWPDLDMQDPNLKFIDLDGDGHADILLAEDQIFRWYPSLAEDGFGPPQVAHQPMDEEKGPRLIFVDPTQSIYTADLSGDGLTDLVRIRNGEVCYWPNLGYGRFGDKVTMDSSPLFDYPDQFDQRRIRLGDIDGSGTTDIFYLGSDGIRFWYNRSGNSWSAEQRLTAFPPTNNLTSIAVVDLLGNGTSCLVWSSPLPTSAREPMRYIDLMGGQKPHLLTRIVNNLGAETRLEYASSTKFYTEDRLAGKPWITRLPFPVYVVERAKTYDHLSRNRFVTRYAYHHGYFDGEEREFRGFGRVDQWDTEEFATLTADDTLAPDSNTDAASHVPPVRTVTWFHTGAFLEEERISLHLAHEYYGAPAENDPDFQNKWADFEATLLPDTVLPEDIFLNESTRIPSILKADELREACRALKGSILRQEIYAEDNSPKATHPYTASERNYTIELLQPRESGNPHAVFFTHPSEIIDYHYERNPDDPRVAHSLTLEVDTFGNVRRSVSVGYPRADLPERQPEQNETHITLTLNRFANRDDQVDWYRIGLPVEARTYEVVKPPTAYPRFSFDELESLANALVPIGEREPPLARTIPYEQWDWRKRWNPRAEPGGLANTRLRLIEHVRTLYRKDDLSGPVQFGDAHSRALVYETYKLAFTPGLLNSVFVDTGKINANDLALVLSSSSDGAYRLSDTLKASGAFPATDPDGHWWIPSGRTFFSRDLNATAANELSDARDHFFVARRIEDPFGNPTLVDYAYDLLLTTTEDALDNTVTAENDYRVLQPRLITDPNGNRSEVAFDTLGLIVGTALMGKTNEPDGKPKGDSLAGFIADLTRQQTNDFQHATDPHSVAPAILGQATTRIIYDLDSFKNFGQPVFAATLARETHVSDLSPNTTSKIQISFSYSDGFGREIQKKIQAEPGPVVEGGPVVNPRWVGSGWTIFNNKGKPVRQYEPFFSQVERGHRFEFGIHAGVSPILFYDPLERVVATLQPNDTYEKVVFDPWQQTTHDLNDTVALNGTETGDPRTDEDIKSFVSAYFKTQPDTWQPWYQQRVNGAKGAAEQIAAQKAAKHANTPTPSHSDTSGRQFLSVAHNRFDRNGTTVDEIYATRTLLDIEGNQREVIDALGRMVMRYDYDMLGNRIHQASMEAGERWMLSDATGKVIRTWDSRGFSRRMSYDELRRPVGLFVTETSVERLAEKTVYGESVGTRDNHRTRVHKAFDSAGVVTNEAYDFKGNLLSSRRELLPDYKHGVDWRQNPTPNDGAFVASTSYDALNRPVTITTPDNSVYRPTFNEANLLDRVDVNLRGATTATPFVTNIDYNAKGQRELIVYNNSAQTIYDYDSQTFRLTKLTTARPNNPDATTAQLFNSETLVQDLRYTYDPVGNITQIEDASLKTIFHNNEQIEPICTYTYDAVYRLIEAHEREHIGQTAFDFDPPNRRDFPLLGLRANPNDVQAMRSYTERYEYDEVGNFQFVRHVADGGSWNRSYAYEENSLLEPAGKKSNRVTRTTIGNGVNFTESYGYSDAHGHDVHGCMTAINSMRMVWDFEDQLQQVDFGGGGTAYYVYDAGGQRVRKVIETQNGTRKNERIYLGGFEIYREFNATGISVALERESLHVMDDKKRIALIETRVGGSDSSPAQIIRYQFGNHLGSACLELGPQAQVVSYEEYHPYGTTSFQAVSSQTEIPKRYRYTGKERDEESGFYYHGARYYGCSLGRWLSCDPLEIAGGLDLYEFVRGNPLLLTDKTGLAGEPAEIAEAATRGKIVGKYQALGPAVDITPNKAINSPGVDVHVVAGEGRGAVNVIGDVKHSNVATRSGGARNVSGRVSSFENAAANNHGQLVRNIRAARKSGQLSPETAYHAIEGAKRGEVLHEVGASGYNVGVSKGLRQKYQPAVTAGDQFADALAHRGAQVIKQENALINKTLPLPNVSASAANKIGDEVVQSLQRAPKASAVGGVATEASVASKLFKGAGKVVGAIGAVGGAALGGVQIGSGINQIAEGHVGLGSVDVAEGGTSLLTSIGSAIAIKSGAIVVGGSAAAASVVALAGTASVGLAAETVRAAIKGEETPIDIADEFYGTHFGDIYGWVTGAYSKK